MSPEQFRKLALACDDDSVESSHRGHPDFRWGGKIFASLGAAGPEWAMVKLTPEQQAAFLKTDAATFQPSAGAWGRNGYTNIYLRSAKSAAVRSALECAVDNLRQARK